MQRHSLNGYRDTLSQLKSAEAELNELNQQLSTFEALVDARLGSLLDQISELNAETTYLDATLRHIREERLFGSEVMRYLDGAPQPARPSNLSDLSPIGLTNRAAIHTKTDYSAEISGLDIPDIRTLYHKLARRHHPDLARNDADRVASNQKMVEINQAYQAGDMKTLLRIAGIGVPYGARLPEPSLKPDSELDRGLSEQEQAERKLNKVRMQINQLSSLPIVKLSLDVKLARHQGRDLLREMVNELQYKLGRKMAERDYLKSQIEASGKAKGEESDFK